MSVTNVNMHILELPPELLSLCFSYLNGTDLAVASQSCRTFNDLISNNSVWRNRCFHEYGFESLEGWNETYKEVYGKVLHKYGRLLGLWRNVTTCYGGLLHVWYKHGEIVGEELYGLKNVLQNLQTKTMFRLSLDEIRNLRLDWQTEFQGTQSCYVTVEQTEEGACKFSLIQESQKIKSTDYENDQSKALFLEECERRGTHRDLCWYRWQSYLEHQLQQDFERIDSRLLEQQKKLPIQPGLFKGMYGGHGTEIIHVYHKDGRMFAQKISGDPNVPAGEISVRFTLNDHMTLTRDQQRSLSTLEELFQQGDFTLQTYDMEKSSQQPFVVPYEVITDNRHAQCPEKCTARFAAQGTVSPMGYRNPTLIPVHFVVFSENLFGVLWIGLYSFSLFSRVEEELPALTYMRQKFSQQLG